jgi:Fe2+ or Zn2+ uptake regulation protein
MAKKTFESIAHFLHSHPNQSFTVDEVMKKSFQETVYKTVRKELEVLVRMGFVKYFTHDHIRYYSWR